MNSFFPISSFLNFKIMSFLTAQITHLLWSKIFLIHLAAAFTHSASNSIHCSLLNSKQFNLFKMKIIIFYIIYYKYSSFDQILVKPVLVVLIIEFLIHCCIHVVRHINSTTFLRYFNWFWLTDSVFCTVYNVFVFDTSFIP